MIKKLFLISFFLIVLLFLNSCSDKEVIAKQVNIDKSKPSIEITSPENLYKSQSSSLTIKGISSDDDNVKEIRLKLNNGNWQTICTNNCLSWNYLLILNNGYNVVYVQSIDLNDNPSPIVSRTYIYNLNYQGSEISEFPPPS